jgi:molybdopterin-guanine dinucleotide biosynthesis protein A
VSFPEAVGFVVAGGASRRMGTDKALLPWGESTLLDHALSRLRGVCAEVRILCGPEPRYADRGVPVDVDAVLDAGALGGVLSGLRGLAKGAAGVFLAVDLPLVPAPLLAHLLQRSQGFDAVVPISPSGPEPLCAVYHESCRTAIERRIAAGEPKMTSFWPDVRVREIPAAELATFGDLAAIFRNVNSREDYEALAREARRGS